MSGNLRESRIVQRVKKRRVASFALTAVFFCATLCFLIWGLVNPAFKSEEMLNLFDRFADTGASGVNTSEYQKLSEAVSGYLSGALKTPQTDIIADGTPQPAFSGRETAHLADVKNLMSLAAMLKNAAIAMLIVTALMLLRAYAFKEEKLPELILVNLFKALYLVLLLAVVLAVLAFIDFYKLFYSLHLLLFRNNLWLLDPEQDLLLQLMPQPFFIEYVKNALSNAAVWFLPLFVLSAWFNAIAKRRKNEVS